jgi:hypothetical protein
MSITLPTVFISYNPQSDVEETLAIRLHTLGAVHGYNTLLPDRTDSRLSVTANTKQRINMADYFILFSITPTLSSMVLEEIKLAYARFHDKSKIIVVFDAKRGKNLKGIENCTAIFIDSQTQNISQILETIIATIQKAGVNPVPVKKRGNNDVDLLAGLFLAGLGLLVLGAVLNDDKK